MATIITAIAMPEGANTLERITQVYAGGDWHFVADVIYRISTGKESFRSGSEKGPLVHVASMNGVRYLRSDANALTTDNLLSLPRYKG